MADKSQDFKAHPYDPIAEYDVAANLVTIFARRALETSDATDFVIQLDQEFTLGYAYSGQSSDIQASSEPEVTGTVKVTLSSDGTPLYGQMPSKELCCTLFSKMDYLGEKWTYCLDENT